MPLLLIDDDDDLRPLMAEYLTKRGKTVCSCGSIADAQRLFMENGRNRATGNGHS